MKARDSSKTVEAGGLLSLNQQGPSLPATVVTELHSQLLQKRPLVATQELCQISQ